MIEADLVIQGAGQLLTLEPGDGPHGSLGIIEGGALAVRGDRIVWVGPSADLSAEVHFGPKAEVIDARGGVVMPALVDPHTHAIFAGSRHEEYEARLQGRSYLEILASGGGILSTVRATRAASDEELLRLGQTRLDRMLRLGVTTVEIKSGYGLDVESELRLLRIARALGRSYPGRIVTTLLGAHAVPTSYGDRRDDYVRLVIEEMIPAAAREGLADACDVYLERSAFGLDEARAILRAARAAGLGLKLHAGQFTDLGGGKLAAEIGALSADHLEELGNEGLLAMARAGVVAVLLPGAALSLRGRFPSGRRLIDAGVAVALGTDCNPGTSHTENLPLMATLAVSQMGLTIDEALCAVTRNAARALGLANEVGSLTVGRRADAVVLAIGDFRSFVYHFGTNHVAEVIASGRRVLTARD